jgi:uncharacterized cupredoxin-like copper-binding protein
MPRLRLVPFAALLAAFVLSACGAAQKEVRANADGSIDVQVTLTEFGIDASVTEFKPGIRYHFNVTNEGQVAHEFMILPVSEHMGMAGMSMQEFDELALMMIPVEQLPAGGTAKASYTFPAVPEESIELVCMTPGHFEAGMRLPIRVRSSS